MIEIPWLAAGLRRVFGRHQHIRGVPRLLWWLRRLAFPPGPLLVDTPDGLPITINPRDYGQLMLFYFPYCPELRALLGDVLRPGDVCFDLGANVGLLTAAMAELVGRQGKVVAVEPNPVVLAQLACTVGRFYPEQVRSVQAAIAGQPGLGQLVIPGFSESVEIVADAKMAGNQVRLMTIDVLIEEELARDQRPDFIKADIEGSEAELLAAMANLLANGTPPILLIEFHPQAMRRRKKAQDAEDIQRQLRQLGYEERRVEPVESGYRLHCDLVRPLSHENVLFAMPAHLAARPKLQARWQEGRREFLSDF